MRKTILTTGLFLFAIVAFARTEENNGIIYIKHSSIEPTMLPAAVASAYDVNEKVLKSFNETFAAAQHVKWEEHKDYYTVSFMHSGIRCKVNYNKSGYIIESVRYYGPQNLPLNIHNRLKKEYSKKELYGVTEVIVGAEVTYFVRIQDAKNWITIMIDPSGNSMVYEKYRKN